MPREPPSLLVRDNRPPDGKGISYRRAWTFKGYTEQWIRDLLAEAPRPIYHVCCGASKLGDIRIDLFHPSADVKADAQDLPFENDVAGTVLMDPPWALDLGKRQRFITESGRIIRPGGWFILYAPWMPNPRWANLECAWIRHQTRHRLPGPPVVVTKWVKKADASWKKRVRENARRGQVV